MNPIAFKRVLITILLTSLGPTVSLATAPVCATEFGAPHQAWFARGDIKKEFRWHDEASFLTAYMTNTVNGTVRNFFSKKWDTQVFYTATGARTQSKSLESSMVDQEAKAVFIFFHGSGTVKSGGRNFIHNMNALSNLGFSAISFDMPFHSHGPANDKFMSADHTMRWLSQMMTEIKAQGKPVYLVGHSFGPDVIFEFISRYPHLADGVLGVSPAGFTPELAKWYEEKTTKMNFGGDVMPNELGGRFAGTVSDQFGWAKGVYADPTVVNPNLKVRILSGDREEYVPAPIGGKNKTPIGKNTYDISIPLQKIFSRATILIEEGVGHYIFDHKDAKGNNVFNRELLALAGYTPENAKALAEQSSSQKAERSYSQRIATWYDSDHLFKAYMDQVYTNGNGARLVDRVANQEDNVQAKKILDSYVEAKKAREKEIISKLTEHKATNSAFYQRNQKGVDSALKNGDTAIFATLLQFQHNIVVTP